MGAAPAAGGVEVVRAVDSSDSVVEANREPHRAAGSCNDVEDLEAAFHLAADADVLGVGVHGSIPSGGNGERADRERDEAGDVVKTTVYVAGAGPQLIDDIYAFSEAHPKILDDIEGFVPNNTFRKNTALLSGALQVKVTPLAESVIRLLAPPR